jgi:hypothetical protein
MSLDWTKQVEVPDKKRDVELGTNYFPVVFGISVERNLLLH